VTCVLLSEHEEPEAEIRERKREKERERARYRDREHCDDCVAETREREAVARGKNTKVILQDRTVAR
jgi:hypothetical protein